MANLWRLAAVVEEDTTTGAAGQGRSRADDGAEPHRHLRDVGGAQEQPRADDGAEPDRHRRDVEGGDGPAGAAAIEPETEATEELIESELIEEVEDEDGPTPTPTPTGSRRSAPRRRPAAASAPAPAAAGGPAAAAHAQPDRAHAAAGGVGLGRVRPGLRAAARARHRHPAPHLRKVAEIWETRQQGHRPRAGHAGAGLPPGSRRTRAVRADLRRIATEQPRTQVDRWDAVCAIFQRAADAATATRRSACTTRWPASARSWASTSRPRPATRPSCC